MCYKTRPETNSLNISASLYLKSGLFIINSNSFSLQYLLVDFCIILAWNFCTLKCSHGTCSQFRILSKGFPINACAAYIYRTQVQIMFSPYELHVFQRTLVILIKFKIVPFRYNHQNGVAETIGERRIFAVTAPAIVLLVANFFPACGEWDQQLRKRNYSCYLRVWSQSFRFHSVYQWSSIATSLSILSTISWILTLRGVHNLPYIFYG